MSGPDPKAVADGLVWISRFTVRHVLSRAFFPIMSFEMTPNERKAARAELARGLVWKIGPFWGLTPLGLAVKRELETRP